MSGHRRLGLLIALTTVVSILVVELLVLVPAFANFEEREITHCRRRMESRGKVVEQVWGVVEPQRLIQILKTPHTTAVRLVDDQGQVLAEDGVLPATLESSFQEDSIVHRLELGPDGETAWIQEEKLGIQAAVHAYRLEMLWAVLLITAGVSATVLYILHRKVLVPLAQLTAQAERGTTAITAYAGLLGRHDEIGVLANQFRAFAKRQREAAVSEAERAALKQRLERSVAGSSNPALERERAWEKVGAGQG